MTLLCGLRGHNIGTDTIVYCNVYEGLFDSERFGFLWVYFINYLNTISNEPSLFLFLSAALTLIPIAFFVKKHSLLPAVSVLVLLVSVNKLYLEMFNIVRQMAAVVWIMYAAYYYSLYTDKRNASINEADIDLIRKLSATTSNNSKHADGHNRYYLVLTIACLILSFNLHKITLVACPFLFLSRYNIGYKTVISAVLISALIGISGITAFFDDFIFMLQSYNDGSTSSFAIYGNYGMRDMAVEWSLFTKLGHIIPGSALVILAYRKSQYTFEKITYNIFFYGTVICNIMSSNVFCDRMTNSMTIFMIIVYANALVLCEQKYRKYLVGLLVFMVLFFIRVISTMGGQQYSIIPYYFFFE